MMPDIKEQDDEEKSENVAKIGSEEKNQKKKNPKNVVISPSKKIRSKTNNSGPQRKSGTHHNKTKSASSTNR